ncbi:MAG: polyprenyl synthetase family protein [Deltaproteobacteria bacterium]|nr:polyprenyl synthetase family protein [Deltaproteobacteria bacterium]
MLMGCFGDITVTFSANSEEQIKLINQYIDHSLTRFQGTVSLRVAPLIEAMRYSLEGGGKRLRPLLVMASADYLGIPTSHVLPVAAAVEYIHTYSLIHDDLPAIDDDDTRRGKPSSHKAFGEAIAILAGDALLTEAFGQMMVLIEEGYFQPSHVLGAIKLLVHHAGVAGMVGGQLLDVNTDHSNFTLPEIEFIHIHKTGALILASVLLPTKLIPVEEAKVRNLRKFGESFGLAFQISDDLLDIEASIRYSRGPRKKPKPTYTRLMSPQEAKEKLNRLIDTAISSVKGEGERGQALIEIAEFVRTRKK